MPHWANTTELTETPSTFGGAGPGLDRDRFAFAEVSACSVTRSRLSMNALTLFFPAELASDRGTDPFSHGRDVASGSGGDNDSASSSTGDIGEFSGVSSRDSVSVSGASDFGALGALTAVMCESLGDPGGCEDGGAGGGASSSDSESSAGGADTGAAGGTGAAAGGAGAGCADWRHSSMRSC